MFVHSSGYSFSMLIHSHSVSILIHTFSDINLYLCLPIPLPPPLPPPDMSLQQLYTISGALSALKYTIYNSTIEAYSIYSVDHIVQI